MGHGTKRFKTLLVRIAPFVGTGAAERVCNYAHPAWLARIRRLL